MRKLNEQKYCGWCGAEVRYPQEWMSECTKCGFKRYFNPSACTNFLVTRGDSVLMVRRSIEPHKGQFDFPGGFMDLSDESIEDAAYRELYEEVGLGQDDVEPIQYIGSKKSPIYLWQDTEIRNASFFFASQLKDQNQKIALDENENSEFIWVAKADLPNIDFAWDIDKQILIKYFESKNA